MRILGFDTATSACSAAVWEDGRIAARRFEPMSRGQSERLMPMVREVLSEAGADFPDLDLLAVTTGPGAFTGLRIGLAAARGMALAGDLACFGVTTLDAVAAGVSETERQKANVLVVLDSKRAEVYAQAFRSDLRPLSEAQALMPADLAALMANGEGDADRVLVAGDGAGQVIQALKDKGIEAVLSTAPGVPDAATVAAIAAERWSSDQPAEPLRPLYLRPPDAKASKNGGGIRPRKGP
ncbi:MAG TPA: tRNA (adenosine(37)-N6)-threonylcarbamoyltransferase complex dimerization subunit type 1 TsaB [Rhodospirillales bacterium]|jgi:tRNA threonylcarbamoyladenosine biosynthesis protein TsaB|nr:tRNA (adenosine(37)-N6)-threonylcarbamoyltransferase complex dimerization subunit type 1 TsaB [Rhodospirillales bacterium]